VSLGIPGEFDHPKFLKAVERAIAATKEAQKKHWAALCLPPRLASRSTNRASIFAAIRATCGCFGMRLPPQSPRCGRDAGNERPIPRCPFKAISGKADGSAVYPDFDLKPLLEASGWRRPFWTTAILCAAAILKTSTRLSCWLTVLGPKAHPKSGRLSIIARFGVGYDTVDVPTCTAADIALAITPDGVRRPVAGRS